VEALRELGFNARHADADRFNELRDERDADCQPVPSVSAETVNVIEDVHALTKEAAGELGTYDLILYVMPRFLCGLRMLVTRARAWFRMGHYDFDAANGGWKGTGVEYDRTNLWPIVCAVKRVLSRRRELVRADMSVLEPHLNRVRIVRPKIKNGELVFPGAVAQIIAADGSRDKR
jgi:hypothetical protein